MNINEYNLWSKLTFRTIKYAKNFDLINNNESFVSEYSGTISELNLSEKQPPTVVGEYGYSVWDVGLAKKFDIDISKLIKRYRFEDSYAEMLKLKNSGDFDFFKYKRIILIHNLVLHPNYKKKGISEEFIENIYREYSDDENAIICLFKPLQDNEIDWEYFNLHNIVRIKQDIKDPYSFTDIKACDYYRLNDLKLKTDEETNELKLFALASRLGFLRIEESHLFIFTTEKVRKRMKNKFEDISEIEKQFKNEKD